MLKDRRVTSPRDTGADPEAPGGPPWTAVCLEIPEALAEQAVGRLASGSLGAEVVEGPGRRVTLRIFVASAREARELERLARGWLEGPAGRTPEEHRVALEEVPDGRWAERYQASLRPFPLGARFLVVPSPAALPAAAGSRIPLRLVPGRAFGTGEHPTTRLCAEALEAWVRRGSRWLDVGTGSGILSIVAAGCGAERVVAIDTDAVACELASRAVAGNGLRDRIVVSGSGLESFAGDDFDGIVANVSATFFEQAAARLAAALGPRGVLIASGVLESEAGAVGVALGRAGLEPEVCGISQGWAALVAGSVAERRT